MRPDLVATAVVTSLAVARINGRDLTPLIALRPKAMWLFSVALVSRAASYPFIPLDGQFQRALYLVSYWYLGLAAVRNRWWLVAAGSLLNAIVITLNGGSMPKTGFFGDVLPFWPFGYYSIGDVLVGIGFIRLVFRTSKKKGEQFNEGQRHHRHAAARAARPNGQRGLLDLEVDPSRSQRSGPG